MNLDRLHGALFVLALVGYVLAGALVVVALVALGIDIRVSTP